MEKEVSEVERKRSVKKKYLDALNAILSKSVIAQQELYIVVRGFFSELLKLEYEFTYEELSSELNKIFLKSALKKEIDDFLYDLSESEYFLEKELESEQVREFVLQFQTIVKSMIYDTEVKDHKSSFLDKLFGRNKSIETPSTDVTSSSDDATIIDTESEDNSLPVMPSQVITATSEDRENIDAENELVKQRLFKDQGTTKISSSTQNENILLTFADSLGEKADNLKTDIIKSDINYDIDSKMSGKSVKSIKGEAKTLKKDKKKDAIILDDAYTTDNESTVLSSSPETLNSDFTKLNNLLVEDNSPDMVGIHEFMEESYLNMNNSQIDDAKRSYLKALDIYHKLSVNDKNAVYEELYMLFKKLKPLQ
jgi:hypothetical protein